MREWGGFPHDAFVIAQNGGGDYLIIRPEPTGLKTLARQSIFGTMRLESTNRWLTPLIRYEH